MFNLKQYFNLLHIITILVSNEKSDFYKRIKKLQDNSIYKTRI